ncbi:unnamed protein product [Prorocentrum cordatum]|uniref:Uncharacterized protein n=1 Tax=Prorocentrum cordatum TaxID=2364126 RepID=A0ABN9QK81_9DINO|nr:unnamed protein product [Polarella glacialis]
MSAGSHWRSCRRCVPTATRQPPGNRVQPVDPEEAATRTPCFRTGWPRHAMVSGPDPSKARPLQLRPPPAPGRGGAAPRAQRGARRRSAATQRSSDDACEAAKRRSGKAAKRRSRAAAQRRSGEAAKRRRRRSGKAAASGDDEATTETAPRRSDEAAARQRRRRRPRARALAASPTERCFLLGGKPWPSRSGVSATDCSMSSPRLRSASSTPTGTGACAPPPSPAASGARPEGLGAPRRGQSRAPGPARGALRRGETTRGRGGASFRPGLPPYRESLGEKSKPCPNPEPRTCPPPAGPHPRWAASEPRARGGSRSGDPSRHERGWATRRRPRIGGEPRRGWAPTAGHACEGGCPSRVPEAGAGRRSPAGARARAGREAEGGGKREHGQSRGAEKKGQARMRQEPKLLRKYCVRRPSPSPSRRPQRAARKVSRCREKTPAHLEAAPFITPLSAVPETHDPTSGRREHEGTLRPSPSLASCTEATRNAWRSVAVGVRSGARPQLECGGCGGEGEARRERGESKRQAGHPRERGPASAESHAPEKNATLERMLRRRGIEQKSRRKLLPTCSASAGAILPAPGTVKTRLGSQGTIRGERSRSRGAHVANKLGRQRGGQGKISPRKSRRPRGANYSLAEAR